MTTPEQTLTDLFDQLDNPDPNPYISAYNQGQLVGALTLYRTMCVEYDLPLNLEIVKRLTNLKVALI